MLTDVSTLPVTHFFCYGTYFTFQKSHQKYALKIKKVFNVCNIHIYLDFTYSVKPRPFQLNTGPQPNITLTSF